MVAAHNVAVAVVGFSIESKRFFVVAVIVNRFL